MESPLNAPPPADIEKLWRCLFENLPTEDRRYYPLAVIRLLAEDGIGPHEAQYVSDEDLLNYLGVGPTTLRRLRKASGHRVSERPADVISRAVSQEIASAIREGASLIAAAIERIPVSP